MNLGGKGCSEPRSRHCTPAWVTRVKLRLKKKKKKRKKKMWYMCMMEYYSAIKRKEIMSFATTWMELEAIILSEVKQEWKTKNRTPSLISRT